ncbi:MAG: FtsW/RodA/SpoVE family cell cycle protein, partial [Clostridia bacterium]|nr:FtsW/RodA/SpoVE family cell cycle protein [Clostridia bacterium]
VLASGFTRGKRLKNWIGYMLYAGALCLILFLQRDLGAMLLYFLLILAMFTVGTGKWRYTLLIIAAAAGLGWLFLSMSDRVKGFSYIATRIDIWKNPWAGKHEESRQIVQGLMSSSSGGLFGAGLGLSYARKVAVVGSDYIFAAVCEEFGMVFALSVMVVCLVLMALGMRQALSARSRFHALLAFGCAFELISQMLLIVGGNLNILPLTGVTLPFVSEGGSSLVGSLLMMGMILGVSSINAQDEYDDLMRLTSGKGAKRK